MLKFNNVDYYGILIILFFWFLAFFGVFGFFYRAI